VVRPRADNYEERQLEILDTAAAMFAERGFDGTPMSAIATGCGVSKALLYHYFESKEELLYQMLKKSLSLVD
jgi:Transcriptional regulator